MSKPYLLAATLLVTAVFCFFSGAVLGRSTTVPGSTEFWELAAQPAATALTGMLALAAAGLGLYGVISASNKSQNAILAELDVRERQFQNKQEAEEKYERGKNKQLEIDRCWERMTWLASNIDAIGNGSHALPVEVGAKLASKLADDAARLNDRSLLLTIREYAIYLVNTMRAQA